MKKIITIISTILIITSFSVKGEGFMFAMAEETYIDDIPFDTYRIKSEVLFNNAMNVVFEMEAEEYINDIPFNTVEISKATIAVNVLTRAEEAYIDDIPFDTKKIVIDYIN